MLGTKIKFEVLARAAVRLEINLLLEELRSFTGDHGRTFLSRADDTRFSKIDQT